MTGIVLVIIVVVPSATVLVALDMVLCFAKIMVEKSGDTKCLQDVAVLLRAFRSGPGSVLSTVAKIFRRT